MSLVPKVFRAIPMHVNPDQPDAVTTPWLCDLSFIASAANHTSIFALGLDDPLMTRFMFCTSICVSVKEAMFADTPGLAEGLALHSQRPYAMMRREQNSSMGSFLHHLSQVVTPERRLKGVMLVDEEDDACMDSLSDASVIMLELYFDIDSFLPPIALAAGLITGSEEIEHISMRFEFSRTARPASVASLALMMAAHDRLGGESMLGRLLGSDILHLICDAYRLRLYECRRNVWNE